MNPVQPSQGKHWSRVTADQIAFYYSKGCKLFPPMYRHYFELLTNLERQGQICLTPNAVLERYHMLLQDRIAERIRRISKAISR